MLGFVSLAECVATPTLSCATSFPVMFPVVVFVGLVGVGYYARKIDVRQFRAARRRALRWSSAAFALGAVAVGYFVVFDPKTIDSSGTEPAAQAAWVAAVAGLGAGVALMLGALGLSLGGWIAKQVLPRRRPSYLLIAIDGPAASGKGTLAKRLAQHYGVPCLDTGLLYRAVARDVVKAGKTLEDVAAAVAAAQAIDATTLDDAALRGPKAGDAASVVAKVPDVREALLAYQRAFAHKPGGAVLDGRDIGTVVCPDAPIKFFVTASVEERARRRHLEHQGRGEHLPYETVLEDLRRRDARDRERAVAPMTAADDAIVLDTTLLDADGAFTQALAIVEQRKQALAPEE